MRVPGARTVRAGAVAACTGAAATTRRRLDLGEDFFGDVEIGRDPLDVVMVLERLHELQGLFGILHGQRYHVLGQLGQFGGEGRDTFSCERRLDTLKLLGRGGDLVDLGIFGVDVFGPGVEH
jgi:hypothetical protein